MPITLSPSNTDSQVFKVAAVQAEPAWLDLQGGVDKVIRIVREAAAEGAKIIGFPELFVPGYPWTLWANNFLVTAQVVNQYQANSLSLHSPEMDRIRAAVKEADATIVLGFSERDGASLYISQVTILPDGRIGNHRRKLKATHYEKTIFADGNAQSIYNVVQTPYGRLGSLNCWEHKQPWLKTHFYSQYPQIFVGGWPPAFAPGTGSLPYILTGEACSRMTQNVSMEGGCFGLCCCHVVSEAGAEKMKLTGFPWFKFPGGGFSAIYGPDGSLLTKPVDPGVETIVYADISLSKIGEVKLVADIMGNYSRFDLLHTEVRGENWAPVSYTLSAEARSSQVKADEINNLESSQTYTYTSEEPKV